MSETLNAADEVRKLTRMFQALGTVVAVLDRVGSMEQAVAEAQTRIDRLNAEAGAIAVGNEEARKEISQAQEAAQVELAEARRMADIIVAEQRAKAEEIFREAHEKALGIVAEAKATAGNALAEAESLRATAAGLRLELADLEARLTQAREARDKLLGA